jgi:hypothetical protein
MWTTLTYFDQLNIIWRTDRGLYEGQPTDEQLQLREAMEELTVGRDPKKAGEGSISWTSLGGSGWRRRMDWQLAELPPGTSEC